MDNQNTYPNIPQGPQFPPQPTPPPVPPAQPAATSQGYPPAGINSANITAPQTIGNTAPAPAAGVANKNDIIRTIILIIVSVLAVVFLGLFVWMFVRWDSVKTDVNGQIDKAVAIAENELQTKLESEFTEKEKYPYTTFSGPVDYGELTFEFPKTWSVYVGEEGNTGSDFHAYLNPGVVRPADGDNVMALRVSILNRSTDDVINEYQNYITEGTMTMSTRTINGSNASVFEGTLPSQRFGRIAILKIRDKTATIQTDAEIFFEDYNRILDTVRFTL